MPHWGVLTNGRFSIREDYILMLTEVKELQFNLFVEETMAAELTFEHELESNIVVELVFQCELSGGDL